MTFCVPPPSPPTNKRSASVFKQRSCTLSCNGFSTNKRCLGEIPPERLCGSWCISHTRISEYATLTQRMGEQLICHDELDVIFSMFLEKGRDTKSLAIKGFCCASTMAHSLDFDNFDDSSDQQHEVLRRTMYCPLCHRRGRSCDNILDINVGSPLIKVLIL